LVKAEFGSSSARVFVRTLQPILGAKLNFFSLFCEAKRRSGLFIILFSLLDFNLFVIIILKAEIVNITIT